MSAKTAAASVPILSGWCGYSGDHGRCLGTRPDRHLRCDCTCHLPQPSAPDRAADAAPAALVLISESSREHQPELDLGDVLLHLAADIDALSTTLGDFDGSDVEVCDLLGQIRRERQRLADVEAALERQAARLMTVDVLEWPGGTAERRWGKDRREWRNDDVIAAARRLIVAEVASVGDENGEAIEDAELAAVARAAIDRYSALGRATWRVTALKAMGLDPGDFCSEAPGRATVQVTLADPA